MRPARRAKSLRAYASRYGDYPNRDNVLGPSRLFFSTYLESIWITNYLAAAAQLREAGLLDPSVEEGVNAVADEAANLIGEFDEGFSNRQTWHNAALACIAVWFQDEELAGRAVEGPTGIIAHLVRGYGSDGMWYEGENYHLFALRGQLLAMGWARQAGVDVLADPRLAARLEGALRAPALSALPDFTFPARKDSRFGVSLAQPMYLELWEVGLARLGNTSSDLWDWLRALYRSPAPAAERFDSYLHETGAEAPRGPRTRADLSWWALLEMAPTLPRRIGHLAARQHAARRSGSGDSPPRRPLRQPRVRRLRWRSRAPRSAAPHAARRRHPLAGRSRHRLVRGARSVLVSVHARPQRAPARRRLPGSARRGMHRLR